MQLLRFTYLAISLAALLPGAACASGDKMLPAGKHNTRAPIEVTSDTLDVMQDQSKAVFSGNVVAIQGDVRLKADKMTVHYAKSGDKKEKPKKASLAKDKPADKNPEGSIKKIEAEGNVFMSTPNETASGASGVYDVEHQEIRLNSNVVLTRGQNVLKGDRLTYNFATSRSTLTGGEQGSNAGGGKKERVRALFVPEKKADESKAAPKGAAEQVQ